MFKDDFEGGSSGSDFQPDADADLEAENTFKNTKAATEVESDGKHGRRL